MLIGLHHAAATAGECASKHNDSEPDDSELAREAGAAFPDPAQPGIPLALHRLMTYPAAGRNTTGRAAHPTRMLKP
jgi:hypothetical protein